MNDLIQRLRFAGRESFVYGDLLIEASNALERKYGNWIELDDCMTICSECNSLGCGSNYCPNCGACMKEKLKDA